MPENRDVLFHPFFNLDVSPDGTCVVGLSIDWSDSCVGEYFPDEATHNNDTPAAWTASEFLDRPEVREAILTAVRQFIEPAAA